MGKVKVCCRAAPLVGISPSAAFRARYRASPSKSAFALKTGINPLTICWIYTRAVEALPLMAATGGPRESSAGIAIDRKPISSS